MVSKETYRQWLRIRAGSEYSSGASLLDLAPSEETKTFFSKSGILFRRFSDTQWNLLLPSGETAEKQLALWAEDCPVMTFDLALLTGDVLYQYTFEEKVAENYSITKGVLPLIWLHLNIPFTHTLLLTDPTFEIPIHSVKKYLEYILIPKYNDIDATLLLCEEKEKIAFEEQQNINLFTGVEARRFLSSEPVALNKLNDHKIILWEKRKTGNRLLSDTIPLPRFDEISTINSENTISTYFYY